MYRVEKDGQTLKCAIGHLIKDEYYDVEMESKAPTEHDTVLMQALKKSGVINYSVSSDDRAHPPMILDDIITTVDLLSKIQKAHDSILLNTRFENPLERSSVHKKYIKKWFDKLREICFEKNLDDTILNDYYRKYEKECEEAKEKETLILLKSFIDGYKKGKSSKYYQDGHIMPYVSEDEEEITEKCKAYLKEIEPWIERRIKEESAFSPIDFYNAVGVEFGYGFINHGINHAEIIND